MHTSEQNTSYAAGGDRRRKPRIFLPFPATVRGVAVDGTPFEAATVVDNLSSGGLYLRIVPCVAAGALLDVSVRLVADSGELTDGQHLTTRGVVLRAEPLAGGACGLAIKITEHRFL